MNFEFKIAGLPVSTNAIWRSARVKGKTRVYKSKDYVAYEYNVRNAILASGYSVDLLRTMTGRPFKMQIELHRPTWLARNGNLKKPDLSNCIKSVEDAICKFLLWDDCFNFDTHVVKVEDSPREMTIVRFWFFDAYSLPKQ